MADADHVGIGGVVALDHAEIVEDHQGDALGPAGSRIEASPWSGTCPPSASVTPCRRQKPAPRRVRSPVSA
jgi:hypothetical protein